MTKIPCALYVQLSATRVNILDFVFKTDIPSPLQFIWLPWDIFVDYECQASQCMHILSNSHKVCTFCTSAITKYVLKCLDTFLHFLKFCFQVVYFYRHFPQQIQFDRTSYFTWFCKMFVSFSFYVFILFLNGKYNQNYVSVSIVAL